MNKNNILPIVEGLFRGFILTLIMLLIYAAVMCFIETGDKTDSVYYMITTLMSIMYGVMYAVKKMRKRGWLIGIIISIFYMAVLYIIFLIGSKEAMQSIMNKETYIRFLLAVGVGALSGMLGINL